MNEETILQIEAVLTHYDLGELVHFEKDERGTVNTSFAIETRRAEEMHRYFLRRYKASIKEEELQFEHSLIEHLVSKKTPPVAGVHKTRNGRTYFKQAPEHGQPYPTIYAIFDFITGEDRYTWVNPKCNQAEVRSSARVLAQFHRAVEDLVPAGRRVEPAILELLPIIAETAKSCQAKSRGSVFDAYLCEHLPRVIERIDQTLASLHEPACLEMPKLVIHCDYHPGNLKFQDSRVTGVFDFDWAKLDYRCFDLALSLYYFFADWEGAQDGGLRLPHLSLFLQTYQNELARESITGPLSEAERSYLPAMIEASNLYVLNWTLLDFYSKSVDPQAYLLYLVHAVEQIKWFDQPRNRALLKEAILGG
ncbi:MAG: phosphotransferase [Anaerolineales bacterium]|nr:phosphotransferase [Anaerolineales bacterium]